MKKSFVWTILGVVGGARRASFLLACLLFVAAFVLTGCQQPGEIEAKGHRRHLRNLSINNQNMMSDIDRVLLMDKPSTLSDKRIPPEISN
jgi:hypothetical protein